MAARFWSPNQQFADATGLPYAGGFLNFYATGTSTPLNTYSNSSLSIANPNPIVLDSAGRAGNVFLQNLPYKVVLSDSNGNQIWTADPVWSSDYSALAKAIPINGNPNGQLAGTAGTVGALPGSDMAFDYTNNILYVCTTTGSITTAVWTAVNSSAASQVAPAPAGRLTPTSGTPVISADSIGATSIFYTPYIDNNIPIYNGVNLVPTSFTELTLTLVASHAADTIYDVFVFNNSGVLTLVTGPAWTNSTAGTSARGSGAGTTQISLLNGHWVNTVQITGRNGSTTFTIGANLATYLGTIYTDHTAGQVTCHVGSGQNRKFGIWNAFNRVPIVVQATDATGSWTYGTNTIRASNNAPAAYSSTAFNVGSGTASNGITVLTGLAQSYFSVIFNIRVDLANAANAQAQTGIGFNSTTVISSNPGNFAMAIGGGGTSVATSTVSSILTKPPALGINIYVPLEVGSTGTSTFSGASSMSLQATYAA